MDLASYASPPIPETLIPTLAIALLLGGATTLALFSVEETLHPNRIQELLTGTISSLLLGFGFIFLLLWCGAFL
jgi:hypothetical protein